MNGSDETRNIRTAVVLAGHSGDIPFVRSHLHHAEASVRVSALNGLDRLNVLDDATLECFLTDVDSAVRRRAAEISARHPNVDLIPLLDDEEPLVAEMAAWACGEQMQEEDSDSAHRRSRRQPDERTLARLAKIASGHDDPLVREAAVAALGAIGDERGLDAILAGCRDKPAVRRRAILALAPFSGPAVEAALRQALEDRDWQVRQAAEDLLGSDTAE